MKIPEKYQFIVELGKALHIYGVPSYKIQSHLTKVAKKQGIKGSFMDLPTWINYVFYEDDNSYNYIECIPPGNFNLGALSRIVELTNRAIDNKLASKTVKDELQLIYLKTKIVNHFFLTLAYSFAAGAFGLMIGTNWISLLFSLPLGALVYLFVYLATKSNYINNVLESLSAFVVTVVACLLYFFFPEFNIGITILASIIILVPGLGITTAIEEITSKSLVSGGAKLFDAIISLFKLFFGVLLGLALMSPFIEFRWSTNISEMPLWLLLFGAPLFSITLLPIFQVRKKDMLFGVITGVSGFFLTIAFSSFGVLLSTFIGTMAVVGLSRLFSIITKSPKTIYLIQGIIMLVPGSKSFMGLSSSFLDPSITSTESLFVQVAFILMGIIGGLLFAGVFINQET